MIGPKLLIGKALKRMSDLVMKEAFEKDLFFAECIKRGYRILESTKMIELNVEGKSKLFLRKESSDVKVFKQVILGEEYLSVVDFLKINLIDVKTIVDCGANVGYASIYFNSHFPNARIIAIEADHNNFRQLTENTRNIEAIKPLHLALWFEETELQIDSNFRDNLDWSRTVSELSVNNLVPQTNKVSAKTLDQIMNSEGFREIDFLKIDIEGAERFILSNSSTAEFLKFVKLLSLEIHDEFDIREQIYAILRFYNFSIFNYSETTLAINNLYISKLHKLNLNDI